MARPADALIYRTGDRYGHYWVYACGPWRWYRCEGGPPQHPQWYLWREDQPDHDGEYVDTNPAHFAAFRQRHVEAVGA